MMEQTDTGWLVVFEEQGLHQEVHDSETDVSFLDQDDLTEVHATNFKLYEHPEIRPQIEVMKTAFISTIMRS
jgi:hypothetical protein